MGQQHFKNVELELKAAAEEFQGMGGSTVDFSSYLHKIYRHLKTQGFVNSVKRSLANNLQNQTVTSNLPTPTTMSTSTAPRAQPPTTAFLPPQSQSTFPIPASQSAPHPSPIAGLRVPSNRKTIYDRNLNRTRTAELSRASFAYLFSELVTYAQKRVTGIQDLERRYVHGNLPQLQEINHSKYYISKTSKTHTNPLFSDSPQSASPSASVSSLSSSTAPPPLPRALLASSPSSNLSTPPSGDTSSAAPPMPSSTPLPTTTNT